MFRKLPLPFATDLFVQLYASRVRVLDEQIPKNFLEQGVVQSDARQRPFPVAQVLHHSHGFVKRTRHEQRVVAVHAVKVLAVEHAERLRVILKAAEVGYETLLVELCGCVGGASVRSREVIEHLFQSGLKSRSRMTTSDVRLCGTKKHAYVPLRSRSCSGALAFAISARD